jgi:hypothetical protein
MNPLPRIRQKAELLAELLQRAHFIARDLEPFLPVTRYDRLVDRIHAARVLAEHWRLP